MNRLSWLLYAANVSENIGGLLIFLGVIAAVMAAAIFIISFYEFDTICRWDPEDVRNAHIKKVLKRRSGSYWLIILAFIIWIIAAFTPGKDTVYAIAASEVGEQVLKSETGNLATQALNAWLKKQINPPPTSTETTQ